MKKSIILSLLFANIFISCEKDSPSNLITEQKTKIPIDSLYLSFKIDGELVELSSTNFTRGEVGQSLQRIFKLENNLQDSAITGFHYEFYNENFNIWLNINKNILVDTVIFKKSSWMPELKNQAFKTGVYPIQYIVPYSEIRSTTTKYIGFSITIYDKKANKRYISYLENKECNNLSVYEKFLINSKFNITSSTQLNSDIYSDYINVWFIESSFNCNLYINNDAEFPVILTDGVLRGCF